MSARMEWQEDGRVRRRRIQGSAVRTHGMTGGVAATDFGIGCPHEALQDNSEVRSRRAPARLTVRKEWQRDGRMRRQWTPGELSAHTECQRTGEVHPSEQDRPYIRG